ncbi:DNA-processing protein DprA [Candidatus Anaplasma sp. TIGMIC]|uniref:DNA-processing protein DprA n=1 Tax=Candidatus Anaplasma sp. TIGMIC TaxID=3020713 RepID=UPI00232F4A61|nr:DNA-processing protein DprA [Candidatus Anaplasma sp. TIGMIC]MDB1135057.1 DNA-processing protein DprA [Candidatus Anaplasma sp. TIGMIC]
MFKKLIELYRSAGNALDALRSGECPKIKSVCSLYEAEKELDMCQRMGAKIISIFDANYPKTLSHIFDPPPVITILGDDSLLSSTDIVALVGSRTPSTNGMRIAYELSTALAAEGYVTVSGLARGIDSAVHSVIYKKKPTIAIIANGINVIYPRENAKLYKMIANEGGLLISELPFSTIPKAALFPQRNRIISGLSLGVVVVEASRKSGSLITANAAISQGRDLFAVPGSPLDARCSGSNDLIKQGAFLVESALDILNGLGASASTFSIRQHSYEVEHRDTARYGNGMERIQQLILNKLSASPTSVDDLLSCTKISISSLLAALLALELSGKIERLPGNRFALMTKYPPEVAI